MSSVRSVRLGRAVQLAILAIITAAIVWLTIGFVPGAWQDHPSSTGFNLRPGQNLRYVAQQAHAGKLFNPKVAYEILSFVGNVGLFWAWAFVALHAASPKGSRSLERAIYVLFAGAALSAGIESLQVFLPERAADIDDFLANAAGTMLGVLHSSIRRRISLEWD